MKVDERLKELIGNTIILSTLTPGDPDGQNE
jgi:hypothetical protein